jgi:DNA sulfur modification protein DndD
VKLRRLELTDFRQFRGTNEITFADDPFSNVTLVFGANGSGKTTLLNALTWVLYESVSSDFLYPDQLINEQTWSGVPAGGNATCTVRLAFEHEGDVYLLTRTSTAQKPTMASRQVSVSSAASLVRIDQAGNSREIKAPDDFIDNLLPKKLHHFFFLNGERFEHLHSDDAYEDIESAIKTLLGVAVIERALKHLPDVESVLRKEYSAIGGTDVEDLNKRIESAEETKRISRDQIAELETNLEAREDEIAALDDRLRDLESTRELQKRRDVLSVEHERARRAISRAQEQRDREISERGFVSFIEPLVRQTIDTYEALRAKRELPKPFKAQFIDDLLNGGQCICGADLASEGPSRDAVLEWKRRAGLPEVEETWSALSARAKSFVQERDRLRTRLDELAETLSQERRLATETEEELSQISSRLSGGEQDAALLERRRRDFLADSRRDHERIGALRREIDISEKTITEAKRGLERAVAQNAKAIVAKRRVEVVESIQDLLSDLLDLRVEDVRTGLDKRVRDTFQSIVYQDYSTSLTEHFRLVLHKTVAGRQIPVARSTGQGQILVLSFVGALAAMARERAEASERASGGPLQVATGGVFPFVSDAVFGTLEESYRRDIAAALPRLAPQVVIFASKAQGLGVVEEQLRSRVGNQYVIEVQTPKEDAKPESIELAGRSWPYVTVRPGEAEESRIVAVREPANA